MRPKGLAVLGGVAALLARPKPEPLRPERRVIGDPAVGNIHHHHGHLRATLDSNADL